eukprot:3438977-Alexandrium_andersonii.AAC.1
MALPARPWRHADLLRVSWFAMPAIFVARAMPCGFVLRMLGRGASHLCLSRRCHTGLRSEIPAVKLGP